MADSSILIPNEGECTQPQAVEANETCLKKDNYLGEFVEDAEKEIARENLGVWGKESVYTKSETDLKIQETSTSTMRDHLAQDDPHNILPVVEQKLEGVVRTNGETPFTAPQVGVDPVSELHLATKRFVTALLNSHLAASDPHGIMELVRAELKEYVKQTQIYSKGQLYTRGEVDELIKDFVKRNGTTSFTRPQLGVDPIADSHLATKRYTDNILREHIIDVDPHGLVTYINKKLSNYYRRADTYSKAETYSRVQIDSIISGLMVSAAKEAIEEHINSYDPHHTLREIDNRHYVRNDGSDPFIAPQAGVRAIEDDQLVTLGQTKELIDDLELPEPMWITSGPVQTTVGFVEDNTPVPTKMSLQEIMDAIFYGQGIAVKSPAYGILGEKVKVEMSIHGSLGLVNNIELWQNDVLIGTYTKDQFVDGTLIVDSLPIYEETTFLFKVFYTNGVVAEATSVTKVGFSIFVGILPKWYTASNVTYDYLMELVANDPANNTIDNSGDSVTEIKHKYEFSSPQELKHLFVAIPKDYPNLTQLITPSQQFGVEAFDVIDDIPFKIPGLKEDKIYTLYVYREALVALNIEVTFKFQ